MATQREEDIAVVQAYLDQQNAAIQVQMDAIAAAQSAIKAANDAIAAHQIAATTLRETITRIQAIP